MHASDRGVFGAVVQLLARLGRVATPPVQARGSRVKREAANAPTLTGQVVRFGLVGVLSTVGYLVLFVLLRDPCGAQLANLIALLITALANTALNRRVTFGLSGPGGARMHTQGVAVFAVGAAMTSGALAGLHAISHDPGRLLEVSVLLVSTGLATALRFVLFRHWVFADETKQATPSPSRDI